MFDRSWRLFQASWGVLRDDKRLMLFPLISSIATLAIVASLAYPVWVMRVEHIDGSASMSGPGWMVLGLGYFILTYVTIFCNAALIVAANERLTGTGPGTVSSGFAGAWAKAGAIVPWALLSCTVTLVLRALEERSGLLGRIVMSIVGIAWSLVTYLVVPVIVLEGGTMGQALSRSSKLFKHTWGENMIGNAGFGAVTVIGFLGAMALVMLGAMSGSAVLISLTFMIAMVFLFLLFEAVAAMSGIYRVALYRFATDGEPPSAFRQFDFAQAFKPKKRGLFGSSTATPTGTAYRPQFPGYGSTMNQRLGYGQPSYPPPGSPGGGVAPQSSVDGSFGITIPGTEGASDNVQGPPTRPAQAEPDPGSSPWRGETGQPPSPRGF